MAPALIIAGIGTAIAGGGAVMGHLNQKKAAKQQKKALRYQQRQDNMRAARERREAIRNARISSANIMQGSVNQGAENSSAALGGLGSIQSQLNQGLSFLDGMNTLSDQASVALGRANEYGQKAQTWGSVAQFGQQIAGRSSDIANAVFGANKGK